MSDLAGARPPGLTAKLIQPRRLPSGGALLLRATDTAQWRKRPIQANPGAKWTLQPDALTRVWQFDCQSASLLPIGKKVEVQIRWLQKKKAAGQRPFSDRIVLKSSRPRQGLGECRRGGHFVSTDPTPMLHALCFNRVS
jgi:hypothetical protein